MKLALLVFIFISIFTLKTNSLYSQHSNKKITWKGIDINLSEIKERTDKFVMLRGDQKVGYWNWSVSIDSNTLLFNDVTVLEGIVREDASSTIPFGNTEKNRLIAKLTFNSGLVTTTDLLWNQGVVTGSKSRTSKGTNSTSPFNKTYLNTIPRPILIGLLPYINIEALGNELTLFSNEGGTTFNVMVTKKDNVLITIADKNYLTTQIDLISKDSTGVSNRFYISTQGIKQIIKVEVIDQNLKMELTSSN